MKAAGRVVVVVAGLAVAAVGGAFTHPDDDGARAIQVATDDVVAAFKDFERRAGTTRPFVIVGHSQGSVLGERLLRQQILPDEGRRRRLVAAYLLGAPLVEDASIRGCRVADEVGCVVAFNAPWARARSQRGGLWRGRLPTDPVRGVWPGLEQRRDLAPVREPHPRSRLRRACPR